MSSRSSGGSRSSEADWLCSDPKCGNLNFARRVHCNRCGKAQGPSASEKRKLLGTEIGKAAADKSHGLFSADDWQCNKCGNVNWARRGTCNLCNAPKVGEVEERTGYGGGFNERTGVEYVQREDSDDEFDEFGRRKKKFRAADKKKSPPRPTAKSPPRDDDDEEEEDDDEEEGDLSKYALWSDEEDSKDDKQQSGENKGLNGSTARPQSGNERSPNAGRHRRSSSSSSDRSRDRRRSGSSRSYSRDADRSRSRDRHRKSPSSSRRRSRSRSRSRGHRERRRSEYSRSRSRSRSRSSSRRSRHY